MTGTLTPWHSLGDTDAQRDHVMLVWAHKTYDLVLTDAELLQYFHAVIMRSNARLRRQLPDGNDRDDLEQKIAATLAIVLGKPGSLDLDALKVHLDLFNIRPRHYFRTVSHILAAGDETSQPLSVLQAVSGATFTVAPLIVRKWAAA
jgi:hypothetical protein